MPAGQGRRDGQGRDGRRLRAGGNRRRRGRPAHRIGRLCRAPSAQATDKPIIGLVKHDLDDSPVRITPWLEHVDALAAAGADIIAYDATQRTRPVATSALVARIHAHGRIAMADCSIIADAEQALAEGAEIVGSTLAGYTGPVEPTLPDFELIAAMRRLTPHVVAEGNVRTPDLAAQALAAGAAMVVVGSAITRPEHVTQWFRAALDQTIASVEA